MQQTGGSGPLRETLHVEILTGVASGGDQIVGVTGISHITGTGSGTAYGVNPNCWTDATVAASAQCIGLEVDVDARGAVEAKVGMQIVDIGTSAGTGTATATLNIHSEGNTNVNAQIAVSGTGVLGGTMNFGAGAFQFNTGVVVANVGLAVGGNITAPSLPTSGTVKGSVCIDTSNRMYVKTTAGACL